MLNIETPTLKIESWTPRGRRFHLRGCCTLKEDAKTQKRAGQTNAAARFQFDPNYKIDSIVYFEIA
ncbi:hypothetical protein SD074_20280 [Prolixibacter sp. SD074]|nr:hypothetical protein SD074_20280 [Prolixibacter sp. SD074]